MTTPERNVVHGPGGPTFTGFPTMTRDEWLAEAVRRFGPNPREWRFVCPSCGTAQSIADLEAAGASDPATQAYYSCIGRWQGARGAFDPSRFKPCNYTNGGLFCFAPLIVIDDDGKQVPVFAFAEAPQ
jgi:hypothetical protein